MSMLAIVGKKTIYNLALAEALSNLTAKKCIVTDIGEALASNDGVTLSLYDFEQFFGEFRRTCCNENDDSTSRKLALFNARKSKEIVLQLLRIGAHGAFFKCDSLPRVAKGINAILEGELWFPRSMLESYVINQRHGFQGRELMDAGLTARERHILRMLANGKGNKDIASAMCISQHTVKSHLCNIYAKISVMNRTQAALWAARHLI